MQTLLRKAGQMLLGVSVLALTAIAGTAKAADDVQTFKFAGLGDSVAFYFNDGGVYAGRYQGNLNETNGQSNFYMFCTDFNHEINNGESYTTLALLGKATDPAITPAVNNLNGGNGKYFYAKDIDPTSNTVYQGGGITSAMGGTTNDYRVTGLDASGNGTGGALGRSQRASAITYLTERYLTNTSLNSTKWAGVQVAIWKIIQDGTSTMGTGISGRTFKTSDATTNSVLTLAQTYLTEALTKTSYSAASARWIQSGSDGKDAQGFRNASHRQDFIFTTNAPIPEPAFYQLAALVGLGGASLLKLRRRKA